VTPVHPVNTLARMAHVQCILILEIVLHLSLYDIKQYADLR